MKFTLPPLVKHALPFLAAIIIMTTANAQVIADFEADFSAKKNAGWRYLWNPTGVAVGNHGEYVSLKTLPGKYRFVVDPEQPPGKKCNVPNAQWLMMRKGVLAPGNPAIDSTDQLDHYVIASYTLQADEGGAISIKESRIKRKMISGTARINIYVNQDLIGSDVVNKDIESAFNVPLGELKEGDTVYIAYGPGEKSAVGAELQFKLFREQSSQALPQ